MMKIREKILGATGSVSGVVSLLGSWQVCHNVCLGIVAVLGVIGISVVGMPLAFLTKVAIPLWTLAFVLLALTLALYLRKKCISESLLLVNSGLIVAGVPFSQVQFIIPVFWVIGGALAASGIFLFVKRKWRDSHEK